MCALGGNVMALHDVCAFDAPHLFDGPVVVARKAAVGAARLEQRRHILGERERIAQAAQLPRELAACV